MLKDKKCIILGIISLISLAFNISFIFKSNYKPKFSNSSFESIKATRVIDGDTFDLENSERIRLYEINAPENPKECMGEDAKIRLENLILNKTVQIQRLGKDNFGRTLAIGLLGKLSLNELLVEEGFAYFVKGKTMTESSVLIEQAQEKAKATGRGVWSSLCQTKKDGCVIKGNYRASDNTRIYHTPDCYNYDKITIKPGTTDRWFCTELEATSSGFRKSMDCPK